VSEITINAIGLDVRLKEFYTDFNGIYVENLPCFIKGERRLRKAQKR
jgi:transposase